MTSNSVSCVICGKRYAHNGNLTRHIKNVHGESQNQIIEYSADTTLFKCLDGCQISFRSHRNLVDHLKSIHEVEIEVIQATFPTYVEFEMWLHNEEKKYSCQYYKSTGIKKSYQYEKIYFQCGRSGKESTLNLKKRVRCKRIRGSCKINSNCTSRIVLSKDTETNVFMAEYYKTHYGHICEIKHLKIPEAKREEIATKLIMGVPPTKLLQLAQDNINSIVKREDLITRKDISNIKTAYKIDLQDGTRHKNDSLSVDLWVKECETDEKNPVVYYKRQGIVSDEFNLVQDDFCMIIMTSIQIELLKKFGKNIICIDSTHGLNSYDFEMTTILIIDEFESGFPVAHMFSNRKDAYINKIFFLKVKERAGIINTTTFMTDITNVFYNPWQEVMGPVVNRLFCAWHIDRAWQTNLSKILCKEKKNWVYKTMKHLQMNLDTDKFESGFTHFLQLLLDDIETKVMGQYLKSNYYDNRKEWAYCYRVKCRINTNMYLENMHKVIKHEYLDGKKIKRLDKSLHCLQKFIRTKTVDRLRQLIMGAPSTHQRLIHSHHRIALTCKFNITTLEDASCLVVENEKEYVVSRNSQEVCCALNCQFCNICTHSFDCTCIDFLIKSNICKHIHYVCMNRIFTDSCTVEPKGKSEQTETSVEAEPASDNTNEVQKITAELSSTNHIRNSLLEQIEISTSKIISASRDCDTDTLALIAKNLKTTAALCDLKKQDDSTFTMTANTLHEPSNKKVEKQNFFSTRMKKPTSKKRLTKPNESDTRIIENLLSENKEFISLDSGWDHTY